MIFRICHLAGEFIESLQKNHLDIGITDEEVKCIKLASLCSQLNKHSKINGTNGKLFEEILKKVIIYLLRLSHFSF